MLCVLLLGSPQLVVDQQPLRGLRRKNRALIYYLADHTTPITRDHLMTVFWPDHDRPAAQQVLRTILSDLRKQLASTLLADEDNLMLAPDVQVDVRTFEKKLAASGADAAFLAATLELYRGDFLNDFTLPDSPEFDDWVAVRREYYRHLAVRGCTTLSRLYEAERNYAAALDVLTRALAFDPLQEDLQRTCIRLHYLMGDRAGAIRRYDTLRKLLDEEMGVPPMAETRALYDSIITDSPSLSTPGSPAITIIPGPAPRQSIGTPFLPFTGRGSELQILNTAAEVAVPGLILIEGEPGIGKTRLAEEFLGSCQKAAAPGRHVLVLRGSAHELEQGLPFHPVIDSLRSLLNHAEWPRIRTSLDLPPIWLAEIARLVPELATHLPELPVAVQSLDEARLWEALNQLLLALARQYQVILFLDDLHWADASTIALLGYLVRRAGASAVALLTTTRPAIPRSKLAVLLQTLTHEDRLVRIVLPALSGSDMITLAEHLSPANSSLLSNWLMHNTDGNPYFLTELIRFAYSSALLLPDGTLNLERPSAAFVIPRTVENLIQSRLSRLSEAARRVLDLAAVVGSEFEYEVVARSALLSENAVLDALDELRSSVLVCPLDGLRYAFDHNLTMEVAAREMGQARYRLLHRHVAETLENLYRQRLDSVAGLIASHFAKSDTPHRAAPYAARAAQLAAGVAAWTEAIALYEQALSLETDEAQRQAVTLALGMVYLTKGDFALATEEFHRALNMAQALGDAAAVEAAYFVLNTSLMPQGRYVEAIALAEQLLAAGPPASAITAKFMLGTALTLDGAHSSLAAQHLRDAYHLLNESEHYVGPVNLTLIRYQLAGAMGQLGEISQAVELYRQALDVANEADGTLDLQRHILAYNNLAYYLHLLGDPTAGDYARAGLKLAQDRGSLAHQPYLYSTSGEIALAHDDLEAAERFFTQGLALAEQLSIRDRIVGLTANLGLVARQRGELALAVQRLLSALEQADTFSRPHLSVRTRLWLAPLLEPDAARARLEEARTIAENYGYRNLLDEIARLEQEFPHP